MVRGKSFADLATQRLHVDCAGHAVDVWLATADDGRAATAKGRAALAQEHGLANADFGIHEHDHIVGQPVLRVSMSHTRNLGAVALCTSPDVLGVGVDIEPAQRVLREGAQRHFLNADDAADCSADLLSAWVAKEATFKAADPHRRLWLPHTELLLSRLWLRAGSFGFCGSAEPRGLVHLRTVPWGDEDLRLGVAVLLNPD